MTLLVYTKFKIKPFLRIIKKTTRRKFYAGVEDPAYPIKGKEPIWIDPNNAECAFECLKSGMTVFVQGAAATPILLLEAMTKYGKSNCLKNIKVLHMHTEGSAPYADRSCEGIFRTVSLFMSGNIRNAVDEGRCDYIPIFLSEVPNLFDKKIIKPDISVISLSEPDNRGFCTLGTSVDCVRAALKRTKIIVAQINKQSPRTFGDGVIHLSHVDYAVYIDAALPQLESKPPSAIDKKIGKLIAENLIEDGSTLQMGFGSLPDSILSSLRDHKDLGIHSEMFSDGVVDLCLEGCITNRRKSNQQGRIVGTFLIGTQKLYDFVDNNNFIEMLRVDYVNHPNVICHQLKMCAINSCIEIDLKGQICSDSIGMRMYSGFGGQLDFLRAAGYALDGKGKPIVTFPSLTEKGESKIVAKLKQGSGVNATTGHMHYVVTEYGIAFLFGKPFRQRAHALISIAHPDHREKLEKAAFENLKVMPSAE